MTRTYHIHHAVGQHITRPMRTCIEIAYNRNLRLPKKDRLSLRQLAGKLGLPKSTLHDEIQRGTVPRPNTFKGKDIWDYSAEVAQQAIDAGHLNQGRPMTMNTTLAYPRLPWNTPGGDVSPQFETRALLNNPNGTFVQNNSFDLTPLWLDPTARDLLSSNGAIIAADRSMWPGNEMMGVQIYCSDDYTIANKSANSTFRVTLHPPYTPSSGEPAAAYALLSQAAPDAPSPVPAASNALSTCGALLRFLPMNPKDPMTSTPSTPPASREALPDAPTIAFSPTEPPQPLVLAAPLTLRHPAVTPTALNLDAYGLDPAATYALEATPSLTAPDWPPVLSPLPSDTLSLPIAPTNPALFYRLRRLP